MALKPLNQAHALQIQAGLLGRKSGHDFEAEITRLINAFSYPYTVNLDAKGHLFKDHPGKSLLNYIGLNRGLKTISKAVAILTGALATSEDGKKWLSVNGANISRCKSDIVITLYGEHGYEETIGVSTKQCNNKNPTNAQLYFTTAKGFVNLLRENGINVSDAAFNSLKQFCGDKGYRPLDIMNDISVRKTDHRRFFWEEIEHNGKAEWENIFSNCQDSISRLLFQKAYIDDPFVPDFLIHKTRKADSFDKMESAIYSIDQLIELSKFYQKFSTKQYSVRKGSFKDPVGVTHSAPRFGIIQMQRGGQQQHPEQLQFNLEAGYFYKLEQLISDKTG